MCGYHVYSIHALDDARFHQLSRMLDYSRMSISDFRYKREDNLIALPPWLRFTPTQERTAGLFGHELLGAYCHNGPLVEVTRGATLRGWNTRSDAYLRLLRQLAGSCPLNRHDL